MGCERGSEMMFGALDGDLSAAGEAAFEDHLARCGPCRAEWDRLQAMERLLQGAPTVQAPLGFTWRVLARVDRRLRRRRTALGGLALAGGTVLVAALGVAPSIWALPEAVGGLAALYRVGDVVVAGLAGAASAMLNTLWIVGRTLAIPALPLGLCGFVIALAANVLWLGLVRRLQPARTTFERR